MGIRRGIWHLLRLRRRGSIRGRWWYRRYRRRLPIRTSLRHLVVRELRGHRRYVVHRRLRLRRDEHARRLGRQLLRERRVLEVVVDAHGDLALVRGVALAARHLQAALARVARLAEHLARAVHPRLEAAVVLARALDLILGAP